MQDIQDIKKSTECICKALYDHKAYDIIVMETAEKTIIADYFIVCDGRSTIQVKTLSDEVEKAMKNTLGVNILRQEGYSEGRWIVLDYGSVLVHIFHQEEREFYNLERLWLDENNFWKYPEE